MMTIYFINIIEMFTNKGVNSYKINVANTQNS